MLAEKRHAQPQLRLRQIGAKREHLLIFSYRFSRMTASREHVRQVLMHLGFIGLLLRRFEQFRDGFRYLIHQHQQPAQVVVCFSKIGIGFNCFLELEYSFCVVVLLNQQTAKVVTGFAEVGLAAQGLTKLALAGRAVASLDSDDTQ